MTDSNPLDDAKPSNQHATSDAAPANGGSGTTTAGSTQEAVADPPRETEPCNVCRNPMPKGAHKCIECEEWQSRSARLFMVQGKAVVTVLPIFTLCIGFIAQIDGLWAERLKGFHLSCTPLNTTGTLRRFSGETLILSDLAEPVFLGPLTIGPDGTQPVLDQRLNDQEGAQPIGNGPMRFTFTIAAQTLNAVCDSQDAFAVSTSPRSLSARQSPIRIASCQC